MGPEKRQRHCSPLPEITIKSRIVLDIETNEMCKFAIDFVSLSANCSRIVLDRGERRSWRPLGSANVTTIFYPGNLHELAIKIYYRPQRSWSKVIFSEVCVKNSVHRGEGLGPDLGGRLVGLTGGV